VIFNWTEQEIATLSKCFCATTQDDSDREQRINKAYQEFLDKVQERLIAQQ
jgi:hypothetical protein